MDTPAARLDPLRYEIAVAAARLIADSGLNYAAAKHKAARQILGEGHGLKGVMPDNEQIDAALREHLDLFDADHGERVARMRRAALAVMQWLEPFRPLATGAVWKGLAAEHATIHLQLFCDNTKDVQFSLIDRGIQFDAVTVPHFRTREPIEGFVFQSQGEPVLLSVYSHDDLRGALKSGSAGAERGDRRALAALSDSAG
jgi:hypothetical protein